MKRLLSLLATLAVLTLLAPTAPAQPSEPAPSDQAAPANADNSSSVAQQEAADSANKTAAAAAVTQNSHVVPRAPDFLEHLVDEVLVLFNVRESGNTWTHYGLAALFLIGGFFLRHIVTNIVFRVLKKFAERTTTTLDDKLFPALEGPCAAFVTVAGIFAALSVLKLSERSDLYIGYGSTVAFSLVIFWGLLRAFGAVLDHAQEIALQRQMGVAAFMPWIKKSLITVFVVVGSLMVIQSLGFDVKALLAGLGIGGLAFALAAQDTIANLFGSIVVAIDQPFKIGEFIKIGGLIGGVEDIGLRSTKLRALDKSLIVIPNKTVAAETIVNLARFTQRRCEQVIGLTYSSKPEQMDAIVAEFKELILKEDYVDPTSVMVYFRDFNACSLDIWIVYVTKDGDFQKHMRLRQKLNLEFMRAVERRGLSFAFPTQTIEFSGDIARQMAASRPLGPNA